MHACPESEELDLNPVMVLPAGAMAVDARVRVGGGRAADTGRRIRH